MMLRKGIHYWALPENFTLEEKLQLAKNAGFEGIELTILKSGCLQEDSSDEELLAIRKEIDGKGLELIDISNTLNWHCSLTSNEKEIRELAKNRIKHQIDIAEKLGSNAILALPGFVGLDFSSNKLFPDVREYQYDPSNEVIDYDIAYQRALEAFFELCSYARKHSINICIENIWNHFLISPLEMKNFIDAIGSEWFGAYFDTGNVMPIGYPEQWIRILGQRIKRVHFKDYVRHNAMGSGFVNLLEGDVDFVKVTEALQKIGYQGWVTVETNASHQYPEHTAYACADALDRILGIK